MHAVHRPLGAVRVGVAHPDRGRVLRRVAHEPGVHVVVGGPGLAGHRHADLGAGARAARDVVLEDARHLVGHAVRERPRALGGEHVLGPVGLHDLRDRQGLHAEAPVRQGGVGRRHVEGRHLARSQADRGHVGQVAVLRDAHVIRRVDHLLGSDIQRQLLEDRVVGAERGGGHRDGAPVAVGVGGHVDGAVLGVDEVQLLGAVERGVRVDPVPDRLRQHEGLEGGAGLTEGLGGQVELVLLVEGLARGHRPDVALLRVDHDDRGVRVPVGVQVLLDRRAGGRLQHRVDRGVDPESALLDLLLAVAVDQLLADVLEEVLLALALVGLAALQPEAGHLGLVGALLGDVALVGHLVEHQVAPLARRVGVAERVVRGRRLREARQQRGLGQRDLGDVLVEERQRCRLHARRVLPVEDAVQVAREDLVLRVPLLVLVGEVRLLDLLRERAPGLGVVEVLDQLHRDRAAALVGGAALQVAHRGAGEAVVVDAVVAVEALVLDRDGRVLQDLGDPVAGDDRAVGLAGHDPEEVLVLVVDARVLAEADLLELAAVQALAHGVDRQGRHQHEAAHDRREHAADDEGDVLALAVGAPSPPEPPSAQVAHGVTGGRGRMLQATWPEA